MDVQIGIKMDSESRSLRPRGLKYIIRSGNPRPVLSRSLRPRGLKYIHQAHALHIQLSRSLRPRGLKSSIRLFVSHKFSRGLRDLVDCKFGERWSVFIPYQELNSQFR